MNEHVKELGIGMFQVFTKEKKYHIGQVVSFDVLRNAYNFQFEAGNYHVLRTGEFRCNSQFF